MIFTSRTYRKAIRRSMGREHVFAWCAKNSRSVERWIAYRALLHTQIARTARLQRRKRREQK